MSLITITINPITDLAPVLARLDRIDISLRAVAEKVNAMANDFTQANAKLDELQAKANETADTLRGLAQAVVDLKNASDVQPAIDALTAKAQTILDGLTAAEDEADDQLPQP